jgi:serine O-acetyltransferase
VAGSNRRARRALSLSPERLWLLSIALRRRGHRRSALFVKRLNAFLYHNSLPINATVSPDVSFGHHGFGVIVHDSVVIGRRVRIWHHVTLAVRGHEGRPAKIIIEDDVRIGAGAVIITPFGREIRIGRDARIGAGAVVTEDVPAGATVVSAPNRVLMDRAPDRLEKTPRERITGGHS